jgi:hypothetical protein
MIPVRCCHPAERLFEQHVTVAAAVVVPQHDCRIEYAPVEVGLDIARRRHAHFDNQTGVGVMHMLEQHGQFSADNVMTDADL